MKIIFYTSLFLLIYTYLLYPLILTALNRLPFLRKKTVYKEEEPLPAVSILVAVHNEEAVIEDKIKNCFEVDYPAEKLQVIFGSDGSTDRTAEILKRYRETNKNLLVHEFINREGKPSTLNRMVRSAQGDILLFSDADTFLDKGALKKMVGAFRDKSAGCVCGKIELKSAEGREVPESVYWKYESWLKKMESNIGSVIGAAGGLYAMRKELWEDIPPNTLIDDFVISMQVTDKKRRIIFEPAALAYERPAISTEQEFVRRVRTGAGGFQTVLMLGRFLNPLKGLVAWEFLSHKVIKWCGPFLLIAAFFSNLFLLQEGEFYMCTLSLQIVFYMMSILGKLLKDKIGIFGLSYHFIVINAAIFTGFLNYIFGFQKVTWKKAEKAAWK